MQDFTLKIALCTNLSFGATHKKKKICLAVLIQKKILDLWLILWKRVFTGVIAVTPGTHGMKKVTIQLDL